MKYLEFFAGGGMVRAGLGPDWICKFSNDIDVKKTAAYRCNWGDDVIIEADIADVDVGLIPTADLAWASFPCQDLSQAGAGAGLRGRRSGAFWPFWSKIEQLKEQGRSPKAIVLENVRGTLTSHQGRDFAAICRAFRDLGYKMGAILVDAKNFVPQSRPRLFILGLREDVPLPADIIAGGPSRLWHSKGLVRAYRSLAAKTKSKWVWWNPPAPPARTSRVRDVLEDEAAVRWHTTAQTAHLLSLMDPTNLAKLRRAQAAKVLTVGAVFRRRRPTEGGAIQRAEVRFDDIAGCLRTPAGGSSRQTVVVVEGDRVRSRLLTPREGARLMGLPDEYVLPTSDYDAHHLVGDGVVVPVVAFLAANLLVPALRHADATPAAPSGVFATRPSELECIEEVAA